MAESIDKLSTGPLNLSINDLGGFGAYTMKAAS